MVRSLATYLNLYLATSIHWTRLYERGHGQCYSSVIAVSVPARTGEKRERTTHHHREQAACLQTKGDSRNVT